MHQSAASARALPVRALGRRLAPGLLSGALLAAATPPALSPVLPFLALVPLAAHLARLPAHLPARGGVLAVEAGALAAAVQHGWGLRWLPGTLTAIAGPAVGWAASLAVLLTLSAFGGAAAWSAWRLLRARVPLAVALALAWTALDWTLAHLPFGLAFPWAPLGLGLARWPAAVGIAEWVGVNGLTAWMAVVNGLVASALVGRLREGTLRPHATLPVLAGALLVALAPVAWGLHRARTLTTAAAGEVAVLALDVPADAPPELRAAAALTALERVPARARPPELVALPEMALPLEAASSAGRAALARVRGESRRLGAPILVGALITRAGAEYNSALLVGGAPFRADKRRLVPGAERGTAAAPPWLAPGAGYEPGRGWPVLRAGRLRAGVLLCYEVAFAEDARRLVRGGARALVALSSDAWFGGPSAAAGAMLGVREAGIAQQLAHLTLRVVETRTAGVRSANGGPAAVVEPTGRQRLRRTGGALHAELRAVPGLTLFVRIGDWLGPGAALLLVLALTYLRCAGGPRAETACLARRHRPC